MPYVLGEDIRSEITSGVGSNPAVEPFDDIADAVTEAIDKHCHRTFVVPTEATARLFRPTYDLTMVDDLDDIASTEDLAVAVDRSGEGEFTSLASSEYVAETNRDGMVTLIRSTGLFPYSRVRPQTVRVTARWGWPATPEGVKRAALSWGVRLYNRRNSPTGVMGFADVGGLRLSTMDPDVRTLLAPFVNRGRLLR